MFVHIIDIVFLYIFQLLVLFRLILGQLGKYRLIRKLLDRSGERDWCFILFLVLVLRILILQDKVEDWIMLN